MLRCEECATPTNQYTAESNKIRAESAIFEEKKLIFKYFIEKVHGCHRSE